MHTKGTYPESVGILFIARDGEINWTKTEVCVVTREFRDTLYIHFQTEKVHQ